MAVRIQAEPLTSEAFAPFGEVIEISGEPSFFINAGRCGRYHDLARPEVRDGEGAVAISMGRSDAVAVPLEIGLLERHPFGSQAFIPLGNARMLVVVAPDFGGVPGPAQAFLARPGQGVQYHVNVWHGVLAPLEGPAEFLIVDRVGPGDNLEEYHLPEARWLLVNAHI
jgi:ureidoglycolate lyase